MTARLEVEYYGTRLGGWARQPGRRSVQEELERALAQLMQREVPATVAGDVRLVASLNRFRAQREKINATEVYPIPLDERLNDAANRPMSSPRCARR